MSKPKILLQLDTDEKPSSFDAVVAIDAGADHLLSYGGVTAKNAEPLVHGAMFTRGPDDLASTAIFIGGSDLHAGEQVLQRVKKTLFDPLRVSVVLDSNGSNSTASAAVLCAIKHVDVAGKVAVILGATGAVGTRATMLLTQLGAKVIVTSRSPQKADELATGLRSLDPNATIQSVGYEQASQLNSALEQASVLLSCGAAGVQLCDASQLASAKNLRVAIDLNAVSPAGIEGIGIMDKAVERGGRVDYGALGVGGLKMKIHKASIRRAFEQRGVVIDAAEMLEIGRQL